MFKRLFLLTFLLPVASPKTERDYFFDIITIFHEKDKLMFIKVEIKNEFL
jgi:hypothetical protein